jgi:hypothetical protein
MKAAPISSTDEGGGKRRAGMKTRIVLFWTARINKFAPSGSHNEWEIMSAPPYVGVSGDGGHKVGAALS